jgi:acetyl-CoA acyltransferase
MADRVYVIGADMIRFGRFEDETPPLLAAKAAILALDDCDLGIKDIQAVYSGNCGETMVGQRMLQIIGQTGVPVVNVTNACATGASAFREAWMAIRAGVCDLALAVGSEKMAKGVLVRKNRAGDAVPREGLVGSETMPAVFAEMGMEHSRRYGTTLEQFAMVSVKNHFHSTMNPKAMYQKETPLPEVLGSEMIAYPNTKLMCSVNVDGSAAAILCSEKKMRSLGLSKRAVLVRASALASDPFSPRNTVMPDLNAVTQLAAKSAYESGSIGPNDIDLVELHDCFATAEICHYENLQLCAPGEGASLLESGSTTLGGKIPVNVSGGLLSKGHPLGATGIANVCEIVMQLRGEAGARQVADARIGMTHVVGLGSACAVHILERA